MPQITPEEFLRRKRQVSAEEFLRRKRAAPEQPQPEVGFLENLQTGIAQGVLDFVVSPTLSLSEAVGAATPGDFAPARELAELAGRGALKFVSAFDPAGAAFPAVSAEQDPAIARIASERARRQQFAPGFEQARLMGMGLEQEAARDPSLSGRLTRGAGQLIAGAAPAVITGIASGGSIPAIAATAALSSAGQPENLAANVALASAPVPAVAPILRRLRGQTAPRSIPPAFGGTTSQIRATGPAPEAASQIRAIGPAAEAPAIRARSSRVNVEAENALREVEGLPILEVSAATPRQARVSQVGPRAAFEVELAAAPVENLLTAAERTPMLETVSALRKAGLLTGVKTHIKNVGGTGLFQLSEEAARIPAFVADAVLSLATRRRTITGPRLDAFARSAREAATKGVREAGQIIRRGAAEDELARLGLDREIRSGSKILDTYVNGTFRLLNAEDKIFRTFALRRSLEDRARVMAINEARGGQIASGQIGQRTRELRDNPTEDLIADAALDAETAVFAERNALAEGISAFKERQGPVGKFLVDLTIPFPRTPTNIIKRMIETSPAGFGRNAFQLAKAITKRAMTDAEQRAFAQTFGRASFGSGFITLGWKLHDAGLMTGLIEDDPQRRARDEAAGRIPGAIRIGDRWHQITGFAPGASLLAIGATLAREMSQEAEAERSALPFLETAAQAVGEQPLLIGSRQIAETLRSPGAVGERTLGAAIGSFVPTLVSDVAEAVDPSQRDTRGAGITGPAARRLPGLRQTLPEAVDVLGQARQDFGPGQVFLDPTRATTATERQNPLLAELVRLDQGISGFRQDKGETPDAFRNRVQSFGRLFSGFGSQLINSPQYRNANDADYSPTSDMR